MRFQNSIVVAWPPREARGLTDGGPRGAGAVALVVLVAVAQCASGHMVPVVASVGLTEGAQLCGCQWALSGQFDRWGPIFALRNAMACMRSCWFP